MRVAVIGSGVAGLAVVHALNKRGLTVTMLDVAETLDDKRLAVIAKLKDLPTSEWPRESRELLSGESDFDAHDLPSKLHFGSDYIYGRDRSFALTDALNSPYPTFARGGFSNVWGAAVLPPDACDMTDWPVSHGKMQPYFHKIGELLPLCGGGGTLARSFPTYRATLGELDPGPQGQLLLKDLERAETRLLSTHTLYGKARLAVHTAASDDGVLPCNGCGNCSVGCVRGSIFGTIPILENMIRRKCVEYRPGIFVERVAEENGQAVLEAIDLGSKERVIFQYDLVFVAAGPLNSARLLLRSQELYDRVVELKESQKFVVPMFRRRGGPTTIEHPSVTLASAFIETKLPALSDHWIHVQVVSMNRTIVAGSNLPGATYPIGSLIWSPLLRRVMAAWCGMHSDHSSCLQVRLRRGGRGGPDKLEIESRISQQARADGRRAAKDLFVKGRLFDTLFCHWMIRFAKPGRGTHCGSSFPMRENPTSPLDSDRLGRPFGWSKIFVVDSSVLPSIPGTTMAFPVMANAYRIGSEAPI
jgi:choline dehydrogenase-like flavoprotein